MWAARNNFPEIITALLGAGADINAVDCDGRTALMLAARVGNLESVLILIGKGADTNKETNGMKAIDLAREKHHHSIVSVLEEK